MCAAREDERARLDDLRSLGAHDQEIASVEAARDGVDVELDALRRDVIREECTHLVEGGALGCAQRRHAATGRQSIVDDLDGAAGRGDARRDGHARGACADDDDIGEPTTRGMRTFDLDGEASEAGDASREGLHHVLHAGHAGEELVVVHAVGEEPVGHAQEIEIARAEAVLRDDRRTFLCGDHAGHDVGGLVDAREAAVARSAHARGPTWAMELGAPRDHHLARGDQGSGDGLAALGQDLLTIERDGDGIAKRAKAMLWNRRRRGHGRHGGGC